MKRKIVLFPLALAAIFGLSACGQQAEASSSSTPESSVSSSVVEVTVALNKTTLSLEVGGTDLLSATVKNAANSNVTWSSSDASVATVDHGTVTAVKEGTCVITATSDADNTKKAECTVTVTPKTITATAITISDLAAGNASEGTLYEVEGILESLSHTDAYGNAYLTDVASGKTVKVYGLTATEAALAEDEGTWKFTNPKDATTTLANINNGEKIKVWCVFTAWAKNISCVLKSHETSTNKYTASYEENENATIALDKTAELAYGDTVTVTVNPASGYIVSSVNVTTLYGSIAATAGENSTYTFAATCSNKVVVSVYQPTTGVKTFDLSASGHLSEFGLSTSYTSATATIDGVTFAGTKVAANKQTKWSENLLCMAAKGDDVATLTLSGKTFNSMTLNYRWWGNKVTIKLESSSDGTTWNQFGTITVPSSPDYTADQTYSTDETFTASTYIKITLSTTNTSNDRIGISSIVLDIA